ncbi:Mannose-6-phosphate isomerase, cupin superfamily [Saccharicrinis carchari]|uniref:Mannose-6-phosphate isomerase, cupin superfamily n=1 Tax=Saccharicrinis carchari TaxID=1168039 RepID=A0A521DZS2_SACCC|nr:cupin domain-containing protein [Saccharicrinis carchari]SMO77204.1 Mannose-6-phosphate isomerase, cupin superfamily [Saccharicrinis carchari]
MISRHFSTEPTKENPHKVEVKQLYSAASAQMMHITLKPGEALKPHKTPVDVVFYVLEGSPTVHIGDESATFEKDALIESPANIVHYLSNQGSMQARILVTKAPRPEKSTRVL